VEYRPKTINKEFIMGLSNSRQFKVTKLNARILIHCFLVSLAWKVEYVNKQYRLAISRVPLLGIVNKNLQNVLNKIFQVSLSFLKQGLGADSGVSLCSWR
jgi:hypothetical protein